MGAGASAGFAVKLGAGGLESPMADLVVGAGAALTIDQNFVVQPRYGLFRMDTGATLFVRTDLTLKADRAEFAQNCTIDARGAPGGGGPDGPSGIPPGGLGGA